MRIAIILNGISRKKRKIEKSITPLLQEKFLVDVFETRSADDAFQFASAAVDNKYDLILAAGGDGTLHQVLNGMLTGNEAMADLPILGLLPIGTGNDFARTIGLKTDVQSLITSITRKQTREINVGRIQYASDEDSQTRTRYFINVADIGMGPEVVRRIANQHSFLGFSYSYYWAILKTFFHYKLIRMKVTTPAWQWEGKARAIAVANGKVFD